MASKSQISLIRSLAARKGLDPAAVLAVARQEGLSGAVGDYGTSFGPFQLHRGGALPKSIPLSGAQAWAWSAPGLNYALSRISSVASGLKGKAAINAIVRQFERPANPDREIQGALAAYGQASSVGVPAGTPLGSTAVPALGQSSSNPLLRAILDGATDLTGVIRQEYASGGPLSPFKALPVAKGTPVPGGDLPGILGQIAPAELLSEGTGGPTHSTGPHIHVAYTNPQAVLAAIRLAEGLGLHVGENPYVGSVAPVHAKNSYHYRTFPGLFSGRRLGEAIDVSGPKMQRFYSLLSSPRL